MTTTYAVERGVILGGLLVPLVLGASELEIGIIEILLTAGSLGTALGPLGMQAAVIHERFIDTQRNFHFAAYASFFSGFAFGAIVAAIAGAPIFLGGVAGAAFSTTTVLQFRIRAAPDTRRIFMSGVLMALAFAGGMIVIWLLGLSWIAGVPAVLLFLVAVLVMPAHRASSADATPADKPQVNDMLRFGIPLTVGALGGWLVAASDRIFLAEFEGILTVGHYGTIARMAGVVGGVLTAFVLWWRVESLRRGAQWSGERLPKVVWRMAAAAVLLCLAVWWPLTELSREFTGLEGDMVRTVVGLTLLGVALHTSLNLIVAYLTALSSVRLIAVVFWVAALVNVTANLILIPRLGIVGAATATVFGWSAALVAAVGWLSLSRKSPLMLRRSTRLP